MEEMILELGNRVEVGEGPAFARNRVDNMPPMLGYGLSHVDGEVHEVSLATLKYACDYWRPRPVRGIGLHEINDPEGRKTFRDHFASCIDCTVTPIMDA